MGLTVYSLTDYTLSVVVNDDLLSALGLDSSNNTITIGGNSSYVGQINIEARNQSMFSTEGDATGSWVHNKNKSRVGKISVQINQISEKVDLLTRILEYYYDAASDIGGLTLRVNKLSGNTPIVVAQGNDCYIENNPAKTYGNTAADQTWSFTCGEVILGTQN